MAAEEETKSDGLEKLKYISLVSKACSELETHVGVGDKVLAEFITDLGHKCQTVDEFDTEWKKNGAEMPDYLVKTLLTIIHAILPPKPKNEGFDGKYDSNFSGLSIADGKARVRQLEREIEAEAEERRRKEDNKDGGETSRDRRDRDRDRDRDREGGRGRDRDRDRGGHRDKERGRDSGRDKERDWDRDKSGRHDRPERYREGDDERYHD